MDPLKQRKQRRSAGERHQLGAAFAYLNRRVRKEHLFPCGPWWPGMTPWVGWTRGGAHG